jgi:uncharacterized protein with ATP-grasp and redox domains
MRESRPALLPADQWLTLDRTMWRIERDTVLCNDSTHPEDARTVLVDDGQPDSFTLAERLNSTPAWLQESERDGDAWLRSLVSRRVNALPQLTNAASRTAATRHVHDQVRRMMPMPDSSGHPAGDTLWNQEVPYVIDRVAAWCLLGDARAEFDLTPAVIRRSHHLAGALLDWFAVRHQHFDVAALTRYALAAGLLDLDVKGGPALCPPIDTAGIPTQQTAALVAAADQSITVDHLVPLLATVAHGPARLVWFTDDLIETAFDLLVIQRLARLNPGLQMVIAPRSRRCDNDATHHDVEHLLHHPTLHELAGALAAGRGSVSRHGPALAAPLPTKLHPTLIHELARADAVVVKGGRNHELLLGTLARPMWTGYVVTREFTEAQAGYDARPAPLVFVHSTPQHKPWWGWRGRAHRALAVADDRTIPAVWSTIADHERRALSRDPDLLYAELDRLVTSWPLLRQHYAPPARTDMRHLAQQLADLTQQPRYLDLIRRAHRLTHH